MNEYSFILRPDDSRRALSVQETKPMINIIESLKRLSRFLPSGVFISPPYPRLPGKPVLPMERFICISKTRMIFWFSF
jgi:hypothetical protein